MSELPHFDGFALFAALDAQREARGLSWTGVAADVWALSAELNRRRSDHPLAPGTLRNLGERGETTCQHALFMLRWLAREPEDFLTGAEPTARGALPPAGPDRRLRWHLHATPRRAELGLYEALDARRREQELTWPALSGPLSCSASQLSGLRIARYAVRMSLAMRITQWLQRPAADFVYAARW